MGVGGVVDVNGPGWTIIRKGVRSVMVAEESHRCNGLYRVLEGKGFDCGILNKSANFS